MRLPLHRSLGLIGAVGCALCAVPAMAQEGDQPTVTPSSWRLSTGVSYSKGDYGDIAATEVVAAPLSLAYRNGNLRLRVSIPYVWVDGPGSLLDTPQGRGGDGGGNSGSGSDNSGSGSGSSGSGSGGSDVEVEDGDDQVDDDGPPPAASSRRSGLGDLSVAASYEFALGEGTYFEPGIKVKLPTGSVRKRLSSGKTDVTVSGTLTQDIGPASLYVSGRRKFAGKPEGSTIRSTWGFGSGISGRIADGLSVGADYDWQQSAFAGRQASSEVTGWASGRLTQATTLTAYIGTGLNANSADYFAGTSLSVRF